MIDKKFIGYELEPLTVGIERGRLRFFAKATGQQDPIYSDVAAAQAAGYRDLPAPPSFMFSMELERPDPFVLFDRMGVDLNKILHGEQSFEYIRPICAGDTVTLVQKVTDIYDKKAGALEFIVVVTEVTDQQGALVGKALKTIVVRN